MIDKQESTASQNEGQTQNPTNNGSNNRANNRTTALEEQAAQATAGLEFNWPNLSLW